MVPGVLPPETVDDLVVSIEHALKNRWGHSGHALRHLLQAVPAVQQVADSATVRALVEPLIGPDAFVARSLFFDKTPDVNWKVAWHQDLTITVRDKIEIPGFSGWSVKDGVVHVQPPPDVLNQMLTVRLHLDDCGSANGPLQVIPGSHKSGRLKPREISEWRERVPATICVVPRGGALLMRPFLLHASSSATEPGHRRVIHLEFGAKSLPGNLRWL